MAVPSGPLNYLKNLTVCSRQRAKPNGSPGPASLLVWSGSCSLLMSGNSRHEEQSSLATFSGAFDNGPVSLKKGNNLYFVFLNGR